MSEDKLNIELDKSFVEDLLKSAKLKVPSEITSKDIVNAVKIIKSLANVSPEAPAPVGTVAAPEPATVPVAAALSIPLQNTPQQEAPANRPKSVLVVDDLGIVIHQLSLILRKASFEVVTSQEVSDAIEKYKSKDFGYAVLDLYLPTDREGIYLLERIKKLSLLCKLNTKIIVMSAVTRQSYKDLAKAHGADLFIEKAQGWQKKLIEACLT